MRWEQANARLNEMAELIREDKVKAYQGPLKVGVDLGTADIAFCVLDSENEPLAGAMEWAQVIKDGLVVDYVGALQIVKRLKAQLEEKMGRRLERAATAIPPGTVGKNAEVCAYILEGAGLEVTGLVDEPTAAATALHVKNGAVVDVGGGTTGISIIDEGEVVFTADEPTGGHHLTLVVAGSHGLSYDEAELLKRDEKRNREVVPVVIPVIEKVASIVKNQIIGHKVEKLYLVGGTVMLPDFEKIIERQLGIPTVKPQMPILATPYGIAMLSK